MKKPGLLLFALAAACSPIHVQPAPAQEPWMVESYDVYASPPGEAYYELDTFYDELASYGTWEVHPSYGQVFVPSAADYVPYTEGYWTDSDQGLTWVSTEPFGWAVCHYGRWIHDDRWKWVPGTEWGPAWVEWQVAGDYVGWAALPPAEGTRAEARERGWRFVRAGDLGRRNLRAHLVPEARRSEILAQARPIRRTARGPAGERWVSGPSRSWLEERNARMARRPVSPEKIGRRPAPAQVRHGLDRQPEESRRAEARSRQAVEQRRAEKQRRADEQRRRTEQQRRIEEQWRVEQRRQAAEERRAVEHQRRQAEAQRRAAEEQRRAREQRRAEEQRRQAEAQRRTRRP